MSACVEVRDTETGQLLFVGGIAESWHFVRIKHPVDGPANLECFVADLSAQIPVGGSDTPADQLEQDVQQESDAYCVGCRRWHQPGPCAAYDGLCGEACVQNAFLRCRLSPGHAGLHNDTEGSTWAPVLADQGESSDE